MTQMIQSRLYTGLPKYSPEQAQVLKNISKYNVVVDSVAGSGKTTCNLHIAYHYKNSNILLLTYNSRLKIETREKVAKLDINNLEVHSYHSFCVKYYDRYSYTDTKIKEIVDKKKKTLRRFKYDMIILDEAQDISIIYYDLICKILHDNNNNVKICILGDINQSIFEFNGADSRYIKYADQLYTFNNSRWISCKLTTSYRITSEMATFINECMMGYERIKSNKISGSKPRYIICDTFESFKDNKYCKNKTFMEIKYYLDIGYKPGEIFILAPSLRNPKSPIRVLENLIKTFLSYVQVFVPTSDDEKLDADVIDNKIVFSSFHQTKGLERKVVLLCGFDDSYFRYYKKDVDCYKCPNELYVATTRAIEHLTLIHHYQNDYMPFIKRDRLHIYCDIIKHDTLYIPNQRNDKNNIDICPTELVRHVPEHIIDKCFDYFDCNMVRHKGEIIKIPTKIKGQGYCENVSEITGIAIPSFFELLVKKKMDIYERIHNDGNFEDVNINNINPDQLLYIANYWNTKKTGYLFKLHQIGKYDWLSKINLKKSVSRLISLGISNNSEFEYLAMIENKKELCGRKLTGFFDCFDVANNIIYEFKCVNSLEKEHYVQLAIYMYMHEKKKKIEIDRLMNDYEQYKQNTVQQEIENLIENNNIGDIDVAINIIESRLNNELNAKLDELSKQTKYVLYNILSDEYVELKSDIDRLVLMMDYIIQNKYYNKNISSDEQFILLNKTVFEKYKYNS